MTYLHFDHERHIYTLRDKESNAIINTLTSVTQLLSKHKLTTNYDDVPEHILENARLFGDLNHAYLDRYYKGKATYNELTDLIKSGVDLLNEHKIESMFNEQQVYNNQIAGTMDMVGLKNNTLQVIIDYKFTYNYNGYAVGWQLNIYKYLLEQQMGLVIDELWCLWYNKPKETFEMRHVPIMNVALVEKLLATDLEGNLFTDEQSDLVSRLEKELELDKIFSKYYDTEKYLKKLETDLNAGKDALLVEMERHGIKNYETANYEITYVAESANRRAFLKINEKKKEKI